MMELYKPIMEEIRQFVSSMEDTDTRRSEFHEMVSYLTKEVFIHWDELKEKVEKDGSLDEDDISGNECAYCRAFASTKNLRCKFCPIKVTSGAPFCFGTPYDKVVDALCNHSSVTYKEDLLEAVTAMNSWLKKHLSHLIIKGDDDEKSV